MNENELSHLILQCAFTVHSELGPGLLESAYEECLFYELQQHGLTVEKQKLNFNVRSLKDGIKRVVNNYQD